MRPPVNLQPKPSKPMRRLAAALAAFALAAPLAVSLSGCGQGTGQEAASASQSAGDSTPEGPTIAIGVAADEPGMGLWHDGGYSGYEVEIGKYVAKQLGYAVKQIVFKQVKPSNRVEMLDEGTVDMVIAGFGMSASREVEVDFAGPYLSVKQDLLIRGTDAEAIHELKDMDGRMACVVADSDAGPALRTAVPGVRVQERDTYPQCVTALMVGQADAVAADDAVLSGLASAKGNGYLKLLGQSYGTVDYGVAVKEGNAELAASIGAALEKMKAEGATPSLPGQEG